MPDVPVSLTSTRARMVTNRLNHQRVSLIRRHIYRTSRIALRTRHAASPAFAFLRLYIQRSMRGYGRSAASCFTSPLILLYPVVFFMRKPNPFFDLRHGEYPLAIHLGTHGKDRFVGFKTQDNCRGGNRRRYTDDRIAGGSTQQTITGCCAQWGKREA